MNKSLLLFLTSLFFVSCEKDKPANLENGPLFLSGTGGVFLANEGVYQGGNASVSYYDPHTNSVINDAFTGINGRALGDICQSINSIGDKLYIVVNNSGKIEVCDKRTLQSEKTLTGFTSPRYMLSVDSTKAYVSDLFSNAITVVNTSTNTIVNTIPLAGSTEKMLLLGTNVYVTNYYSDFLYVINTLTDAVTDSILISKGALSIAGDVNGQIWVLCSGDYQSVNGAIHRVDPVSKSVTFSHLLSATDGLSRLCMSPGKDTLYFLYHDVLRMAVTDQVFPASSFISAAGKNFYGLGVDPLKNEIYVSDAVNFTQAGVVYRYDCNGNLLFSFTAGINPGEFLFLN
jgi:YVTN family beta-propeller protein